LKLIAKKIFGYETGKVMENFRMSHNKEFCDEYRLPTVLETIVPRKFRESGNMVMLVYEECIQKFGK
jgi:hypothetical protein